MARTRADRPRRRLPLKAAALAAIGTVAVVLLLAVPVAATHRADLPFERFYGNAMVSLVSRIGGGGAANPFAGNARAAAEGQIDYTGSCATCHGAMGDGRGAFGAGTYPPATDLTGADTKALSDAQLYWIVKNGISFTAMPAFGVQYKDQDIWAMVEFIRTLQRGSKAGALKVPPPTRAQLAAADPLGTPAQRGAAVYLAQGCDLCHGVGGGEIGLEAGRGVDRLIRSGRAAMPAYDAARLTDAQMQDLIAYMQSIGGGRERD